ncbi:unnamed protein product, partial [Mesorhabditis spiculigera]
MSNPDITLNSEPRSRNSASGVWQPPTTKPKGMQCGSLDDAEATGNIDTAAAYGNEEGVGRGIANSSVAREDIIPHHEAVECGSGYEPALEQLSTPAS